MSRYLYVVRHGIAVDLEDMDKSDASFRPEDIEAAPSGQAATPVQGQFAGQLDAHRPLTEKGLKQVRKVAKALTKNLPPLDLLATSPLVRAVQTADVLTAFWDHEDYAVLNELKPESPCEAFLEWWQRHAGLKAVAIVGHEPHLSSLVSFLLTGSTEPVVEIRKAGVVALEFPRDLDYVRARIQWLLDPRMISNRSFRLKI